MPYELQQYSPRLWFVVNIETGKKHEGKPISLKKAKAQLRILKSAEEKPKKKKSLKGGAMEGIQIINFNSLADYRNSVDTMENIIGEFNIVSYIDDPVFRMEQINATVRDRFRHENNLGQIPNGMVVVVLKFGNKYVTCFLTRQQYNLALQQIPELNQGGSLKAGGVLDIQTKPQTPWDNEFLRKTNRMGVHKLGATRGGDLSDNVSSDWADYPYSTVQYGYNVKLGGNHNLHGVNDYNQPFLKWIHSHPWMHPFGDFAEPYIHIKNKLEDLQDDQAGKIKELTKMGADYANKNYKDVNAFLAKYNDLKLDVDSYYTKIFDLKNELKLTPEQQQEWLKGYDEVQLAYNKWTHEVWRDSLSPDQWPSDSPYNLGKIWCAIYNRSWQAQQDWSSTWDKIVDVAKTGFEIGKTIVEVAV